jgi:hypothetical protein
VICYRLFEEDMAGLPLFLMENGYSRVSPSALGEWSSAAVETSENEQTPLVFVLDQIVDGLGLPTG